MDPNISQQPAEQSLSEMQNQHEQPNEVHSSGGKFKWVLLVIVLLVLVGFGVYSLGANKNNFLSQNLEKPTPTVSQPTHTIDLTANWKTYENTKYGYQLKYPEASTNLRTYQSGMDINFPKEGFFQVEFREESPFYINQEIGFDMQRANSTKTNFLSYPSVLIGPARNIYPGAPYKGLIIYLEDKKAKVEIDYFGDGANEALFDQILSTFKFTDQKQPTSEREYFQVPELGIRFLITPDIKDLIYQIEGSSAWFSTNSLATYGQYCSASEGPIGMYSKIYKSALIDTSDPNIHWSRTKKGLENATKTSPGNPIPDAKEFLNFYILYTSPQAICSDNKLAQTLQIEQRGALDEAFSTVESFK